MIIEKFEKNGLKCKLFSTAIGYHYKIYYGRKVVAQSYVYLASYNLCRQRMLDDLDNVDVSKLEVKNETKK